MDVQTLNITVYGLLVVVAGLGISWLKARQELDRLRKELDHYTHGCQKQQ